MNFEGYELPEWFYGFVSKIEYMESKAHAVRYMEMDVQMAWVRLYHAERFNSIMAEEGNKNG